MILCFLKQILNNNKVIFIQLLESPILPFVCCCSVTKLSNSGIAGALRTWKMHFWGPSQWDKMCFWYQIIKIQWKKYIKIFTFAYGQGQGGCPPPSTVSLTIKYLLFFTPSLKRLLRNVNSTPKTLQFYSLVKVLQPPAFSTKGDHLNLHIGRSLSPITLISSHGCNRRRKGIIFSQK